MVFYKKAATFVTAFSYEAFPVTLWDYRTIRAKTDTARVLTVSAFTVMSAQVHAAAAQWLAD